METKLVSIGELHRHLQPFMPRMALVILMAGDRLSCCDEAVIALEGDDFLGAATIAPEGEQFSGEPTLVGLWVVPEHRGRGIGQALLEAAVRRMVTRGLTPIRVDALSSRIPRLVALLPEDLQAQLKVIDCGLPFDEMLDR